MKECGEDVEIFCRKQFGTFFSRKVRQRCGASIEKVRILVSNQRARSLQTPTVQTICTMQRTQSSRGIGRLVVQFYGSFAQAPRQTRIEPMNSD